MSSVPQIQSGSLDVVTASCDGAPRWYAIQTRAKHEKKVEASLQQKGITTFVPTIREVHCWSDRRAIIDVPMFPCYAFVQSVLSSDVRLAVLQTAGVFRLVGFNEGPVAIPNSQIEAIKAMLTTKMPLSKFPSIKLGARVRVRGGALDGVEGVLTGRKGERKLVVSIDLIQQSIAVVVEGYDVEPI